MITECFATSHTEHILSDGKIDITDSDAAQQIVDEIKKDGGGITYEGSVTFLTRLLMPLRMLAVSLKEGPTHFDLYKASLLLFGDAIFACGLISYAPFTVDYLVNILYSFAERPDVINHFRHFFVIKTLKSHIAGRGNCGTDEYMERLVHMFKQLNRSACEKSMRIANYMLQGTKIVT